MKTFWIVCCSILAVLAICLCCVAVVGLAGVFYYYGSETSLTASNTPVVVRITPIRTTQNPGSTPAPSATLRALRTPTPQSTPIPSEPEAQPTVIIEFTQSPEPSREPELISTESLYTLDTSLVPVNDLLELAARLKGKTGIAPTVEPAPAYQVGDKQAFWASNVDTNEHFKVDTVLRYATEHTYFWIEDGVKYDKNDLKNLAETFENEIYPTDRAFFGSEWSPGVDGDPHLYIVYAGGLGSWLAGYYSSVDEYPPAAHEYSNGHESFMFNSDNMDLGASDTYGTLAHEFQHMIHWYRDRNESTWMNEGFSVLAEKLNDYSVYFDYDFISDPDLQLTDWSPDSGSNGPHYGASFLFLDYFLDRFGEEATQRLVGEAENGMVSIDKVLQDLEITDSLTGKPIRAEDVFTDWAIANYVQDGSVSDGRYTYQNYPNAPQADETESFSDCPVDAETRSVNQFGADYIRFNCDGDYTLHFEGSMQVNVIPPEAHSGSYYFWSNKGDESDMTLTRAFDFTDQSGSLSLTYWIWHDLEKDYDYTYLEASLDGESWKILNTPSCTTEDPSGNSYGCGWNGMSGGGSEAEWVQETVDLSEYAGKKVWLRYETITDAAVNGEGLVLDDIAIPEIGYTADFEADAGGWEAAGFVRIQNQLPQIFRLALVTEGSTTTVEYITLASDLAADIPLHIGGDVDHVTLVVTGVTPFTRVPAAYRFEVKP